MENENGPNEEELTEIISYLIEVGAMEIMGYDSVSDQFTYKVTPECKDIYPELYYAHYEAIGEMSQSLWMRGIIDIIFTEGETVVAVTDEQINNIKKTINDFNDDERFFLETILNHYEQK